jgi:hypothetical protein
MESISKKWLTWKGWGQYMWIFQKRLIALSMNLLGMFYGTTTMEK